MTAVPGLGSARLADGVLSLVLANSIDAIEAGRRELAGFAAHHALAPATINRLEVIFEEVISNIVRHGFTPGSIQSIHVEARALPGLVTLCFEDDAPAFNPLEVTPPGPFVSLAEARLGGLGIPLLRRNAAAVAYARLTPDAGVFRPNNRLLVTISSET